MDQEYGEGVTNHGVSLGTKVHAAHPEGFERGRPSPGRPNDAARELDRAPADHTTSLETAPGAGRTQGGSFTAPAGQATSLETAPVNTRDGTTGAASRGRTRDAAVRVGTATSGR